MLIVLSSRLAKYLSRSSATVQNPSSFSPKRYPRLSYQTRFLNRSSYTTHCSPAFLDCLANMRLNDRHIYPATEPSFSRHASRRSVVHSTGGMVACTQPLAAEAGQRVLKMGGNAAVRELLPRAITI